MLKEALLNLGRDWHWGLACTKNLHRDWLPQSLQADSNTDPNHPPCVCWPLLHQQMESTPFP